MSEEEIKVGNFNKPNKRPTPRSVVADDAAQESSASPSNAELNAKLDAVVKHLQAIDWKIWVYLKANNYID